jgi:hypothetical protein
MEGSVLSFFKAQWKMGDTGSAHLASSNLFLTIFCTLQLFVFYHGLHLLCFISYLDIVTWMHSFHLIIIWCIYQNVSNSKAVWNNTSRYEILSTSNLGCSFITIRQSYNNQRLDVILQDFMLQITYTTVFQVKC